MLLCSILLLISLAAGSVAASPLTSLVASQDNLDKTISPANAGALKPPLNTIDAVEVTSNPSLLSKNTLAELQLFIEDFSLRAYWRFSILNINKGRLFHDIGIALSNLARLSGFTKFLAMAGYLMAVLIIAFLVEWLFRLIILRRYLRAPSVCPLTLSQRIWLNLSKTAPEVVSLIIFSVAAYASYILIYSNYFSLICPFFLSTLVAIVAIRIFLVVCTFFLAPRSQSIRLTRWDDLTTKVVFRSAILFMSILTIGSTTSSLLKYGGLDGDSLILVLLFFGTVLIMATGIVIFLNRKTIANWVYNNPTLEEASGGTEQSVSYTWISLLIFYLFVLWLVWCSRLVLFESKVTFAFAVSLLVVPIFLILDGLIGWLFEFVKHALSSEDRMVAKDDSSAQEGAGPGLFQLYLHRFSRLILIGLLLLWLLHLWGFHFSYTSEIIDGIRKIFIVFIIFFFLWQLIDKSLKSFVSEKEGILEEEDDSGESEWGDGALLDRSQTLLPIVRKFFGILMLVMLVLFTLSSLGVNIGPLLAGAGVMGIAIGFGAQKLVSDLLSGFFFLVDDAFRVGEYIEAGSNTGTVEKITLRNIMLRHHRGMLMIIPYSDLGAITNYMRGGIVVKFNLQLPYDTNVDMVRKVVKRVGIEMLDDPEIGKNFIKQLKSQGIREVGDSVLTIRVKFTAKPGTHFVIRREAYRRITEALNAKNIYYAHRKVIVDFPDSLTPEETEDQTRTKMLEAGAAASLAVEDINRDETKHTK